MAIKLRGPVWTHGIKRNKYGAIPCTVDGIRFASTREAKRYRELAILRGLGAITDLELQPRFSILAFQKRSGLPVTCGTYKADFQYIDNASGEVVVEDVKSEGTRTTAYRLRKRLVEASHGITIVEV